METLLKIKSRPNLYVSDFVTKAKVDIIFDKDKKTFTYEVPEIFDILTRKLANFNFVAPDEKTIEGLFYEPKLNYLLGKGLSNYTMSNNFRGHKVFFTSTLVSAASTNIFLDSTLARSKKTLSIDVG